MSDKRKQILDGLKNLNAAGSEIFSGVVKSVDEQTATMEVMPDPEDEDYVEPVMLRSCVTDLKGIVLIPKVGSEVSYASIDSGGEFTIVNASALDKVLIDVPELNIKCDNVVINGGNNGGVPILKQINSNLDAIKNYLKQQNAAIATGLSSAASSDPSAGATFTATMKALLLNFVDMEDKKVKH